MSTGVSEQPRAVNVYDGVATSSVGNVYLVVYQRAARLPRTRFIFDGADALAKRHPEGIHCLMLILPTADPPDTETQRENRTRLQRLRPVIRQLISVPIGDTFRISVVRTIMRCLNVVQGFSHTHRVESSLQQGIARLISGMGGEGPTATQITARFAAMLEALGLTGDESNAALG